MTTELIGWYSNNTPIPLVQNPKKLIYQMLVIANMLYHHQEK